MEMHTVNRDELAGETQLVVEKMTKCLSHVAIDHQKQELVTITILAQSVHNTLAGSHKPRVFGISLPGKGDRHSRASSEVHSLQCPCNRVAHRVSIDVPRPIHTRGYHRDA